MQTASGFDFSSISATSANPVTPNSSANAVARSGKPSQTATSSDSGSAASAAAWIRPTLPQPIRAVRSRVFGIRSLREILRRHLAQEGERFGHLAEAVHTVLNADPTAIAVLGQDPED